MGLLGLGRKKLGEKTTKDIYKAGRDTGIEIQRERMEGWRCEDCFSSWGTFNKMQKSSLRMTRNEKVTQYTFCSPPEPVKQGFSALATGQLPGVGGCK